MQKSSSDLEYAAKKKLTRRDFFLAEIDEATPWSALWQVCSEYGCEHDRDVNAAKNILKKFSSRVGHDMLVVGISAL